MQQNKLSHDIFEMFKCMR